MDMPALMKQFARHVPAPSGTRIIAEGSLGDTFYYIISGRVKITKRIGDEEETLRELSCGDFFGELALIHDNPRAASVYSMEDSELYEMGRTSFYEMLKSNPEISLEVLCASTNWLLESDRQYIRKLKKQTKELAGLLEQKEKLTGILEHESRLLAQEKEKYQSLLDHSLVAVFVIQEGRIVFMNSTFLDMTGYSSPEEGGPLPVDDFFIPGTKVSLKGEGLSQETDHYEVDIRTASNDVRTWEIRSVPIAMSSGRAILANASDLTEKKLLELANEEARIQIMQDSKLASIGFLAAGIAHNLNNPLTAIYTVAQLIRQEHPDMSEADRIIHQCRNMMNIIQNLMTKSRMDQSDETIPIDLNKLLDDELKFYEAHLDFKHNVTKQFRYESGLPVIKGVYSDFSQAIMNIVKNSVDAMCDSPEKSLCIRTYSDANHVFIEVSDTGCGISEEHLDRIFDPFFTTKPVMHDSSEGEPAGTGLGLASSLQLIRKYHGSIKVKSTLGKGTTATIVIPRESAGSTGL